MGTVEGTLPDRPSPRPAFSRVQPELLVPGFLPAPLGRLPVPLRRETSVEWEGAARAQPAVLRPSERNSPCRGGCDLEAPLLPVPGIGGLPEARRALSSSLCAPSFTSESREELGGSRRGPIKAAAGSSGKEAAFAAAERPGEARGCRSRAAGGGGGGRGYPGAVSPSAAGDWLPFRAGGGAQPGVEQVPGDRDGAAELAMELSRVGTSF